MECTTSKEVLNLKWITHQGNFDLHRMREPCGSFERLCSEAFSWQIHRKFDYAISGALASLFFTFSTVDGLAYSSSATAMKGVNLALKTTVADQFVVPRSFRSYRVLTVQGNIEWEEVVDCPGHHVSHALFERPQVASSCGNATPDESPGLTDVEKD
jgi:hypothetical protein